MGFESISRKGGIRYYTGSHRMNNGSVNWAITSVPCTPIGGTKMESRKSVAQKGSIFFQHCDLMGLLMVM